MGNLVADAMLDRVEGQGVTIALHNGGGLRASIGGGTVTMGDVLAVLPFQNTLSTFNVPGAGHRRGAGERRQPGRGGRRPLPAGRGAALQLGSEGAADRGADQVRRGAGGRGLGAARPGEGLLVATNNFMRNGGDGYSALRDQATNAYDFGPGLEDVLANYLADHPDYLPETHGRITRLE